MAAAVRFEVVLEISVGLEKSAESEYCHLVTAPVPPVRVSVGPEPVQTGFTEAAVVPPAEAGLTVTVATEEVAGAHTPLVTMAR